MGAGRTMARTSIEISAFVPCYNEEHILERNILRLARALDKTRKTYELVIVDDSSTDGTARVGKRLAKHKGIRYLRFNNGPSRRENLGRAFRTARGKTILFMDADLATDLKHLPALITGLKKNEVMIGSRYDRGAKIIRTPMRRAYSATYNAVIRLIFRSKLKDHQCGFKAFRRSDLFTLLNRMGYDKTFNRGWFWDAELLMHAQHTGLRIGIIPVVWNRGVKSSFSFKREIKVLPYIIALRTRWK